MSSTFVYIISALCAIWVIYDVWAKQTSMESIHKIIWTVCALFFNIITAIVYYFVKKR